MKPWMLTGAVAAALAFGSPVLAGPAHAAPFKADVQKTEALKPEAAQSTDLGARRRYRHHRRHVHRPHYRPYYYGRPTYYRPYDGLPPFFPFGIGYGFGFVW